MDQADPTAVAAAASIGKLFMMKKGNQPENKQKLTYRSASLTNLRKQSTSKRVSSISTSTSESVRGNGKGYSGKVNSLTQHSSTGKDNSLNSSLRKGPQYKIGSHHRTSSLPSQRGQSSRSNSNLQRQKSKTRQRISYDEAQRTFKDFGGPQARGILTNQHRTNNKNSSAPLMTTRKYIPGPNGLIAIEVPVEEPANVNTFKSLRRSNSAHSALNVRNSTPLRRKVSQGSLHSQPKRTSSLRNSSTSQTKQGEKPVQEGKIAKKCPTTSNVPLIETKVPEETDQELNLENSNYSGSDTVVNSENILEKPSLNGGQEDDLTELINENIELEGFIKEEEKEKSSKYDEEDVPLGEPSSESNVKQLNERYESPPVITVLTHDKVEKEDVNKPIEEHRHANVEAVDKLVEQSNHISSSGSSSLKEITENDRPKNDPLILASDAITFPTQDFNEKSNLVQEGSILEGSESSQKAGNQDSTSERSCNNNIHSNQENVDDINDKYFDTVEETTQEMNKPGSSQKIDQHKQTEPTPSLAQYLRTSSNYLSPKNRLKQAEQNNLHKPEAHMVPVTKVVTPIKSALKKSSGLSSHNTSIYSDNSPANGAYLSLTTAENTRLNAQMSIPDGTSRRNSVKRSSMKRPQSVGQFRNNRSSSPSPPEKLSNKRHSAIPLGTPEKGKPKRNSTIASLSKHSHQMQEPTGIDGLNGPKKYKNSINNNSVNKSVKGGSQVVQSNKRPTKDMSSILYPKEPPPRKSSFEKTRSNESHLGFKKLSLRSGDLEDGLSDDYNGQGYHNSTSMNRTETAQEFFKNLGHSSRFADSDSEDDSQFLNQSSSKPNTETEGNKVINNKNSSGGSGAFSLFKSKSKQKENEVAFPGISRQNHNASDPVTPSKKMSKKFSGVSLRVVSEAEPAKSSNPSMTNRLRFSSNPENNENRHTQVQEINTTKEKKGGFGKKLKKIFGRKK